MHVILYSINHPHSSRFLDSEYMYVNVESQGFLENLANSREFEKSREFSTHSRTHLITDTRIGREGIPILEPRMTSQTPAPVRGLRMIFGTIPD